MDLIFLLPFEVHATDFVIGEIEDPGQDIFMLELIESKKLYVAGKIQMKWRKFFFCI